MSEEYPFGFDPEDMEEISDMLDYVVGSHIDVDQPLSDRCVLRCTLFNELRRAGGRP